MGEKTLASAQISAATGLKQSFVQRCQSALAMEGHEMLIAFVLFRQCATLGVAASMAQSSMWMGCAVLAVKLHDEDDFFDYTCHANRLADETDAGTLKRCEEHILNALEWRIPLSPVVYDDALVLLHACNEALVA